MPAPRADIDRHAVCAKAAMSGIRPTAEHFGLPVSTVKDICHAAGVVLPTSAQRTVRITDVSARSAQMQPAHAVITDELSTRGANSRLNAARIGDGTLGAIASEPPERQIALLEAANQAASLLVKGNVPGWEREREGAARVGAINIALFGLAPPECGTDQSQEPVSIDAAVVPQVSGADAVK